MILYCSIFEGVIMINISSEKLKSLKEIGVGNFGTVYRDNDVVYKIYHDEVKTNVHRMVKNPVLKHRNMTINKINRLIRINNIIKDIVYVDGVFYGIMMDYLDGKLFYDIRREPLQDKIDYAYKLVKNARKLTDNNIYPLDYRLTNIMISNGDVKILDLDDVLTKVRLFKSKYLKRESIIALDETIRCFFRDGYHTTLSFDIADKIDRKNYKYSYSYDDIKDYIDYKNKKNLYIFIDDECNEFIDDGRVILTFENRDKDYIVECINKLNEKGIDVYDVIYKREIDDYIDDVSYSECYMSKDKRLVRIK